MGEWEVGVRCTDASVHDVLRRALAHHVVDEPESSAPANFSLHIAEDGGPRATRDFHLLYRSTTSVVRSRSVRRVVDGLLGYLSCLVEDADERSLPLDLMAFVKDGAAVLAPAEIRHSLATIERRLNAKGVRVVDRPWVNVDASTAELVVPVPELEVDVAALDELGGSAGRDAAVEPGRYPVVGWGFGVGRDEPARISRAVAVTLAAARLVERPKLAAQVALDRLARILAGLEPAAVWAERGDGLVDPIVALFG